MLDLESLSQYIRDLDEADETISMAKPHPTQPSGAIAQRPPPALAQHDMLISHIFRNNTQFLGG